MINPNTPAPAAPYGRQPTRRNNTLLFVLLGVAAFVLLCCGGATVIGLAGSATDQAETESATLFDTGDTEQGTAATSQPAPDRAAPKTTAKPKPAGPGIGDPARDGKFQFTVTKVSCGKTRIGTDPFDAKAQGAFCLVNVTVKNIGDEPRSFSGSNQQAFSADGAEYGNDTMAEMRANDGAATFLENINPGNTVRGALVFDVPKGTKLTRIELHDSAFSGGVSVRLS